MVKHLRRMYDGWERVFVCADSMISSACVVVSLRFFFSFSSSHANVLQGERHRERERARDAGLLEHRTG